MHIIDNEGKKIEVTDPDKAIEQAKNYSAFMHEDEFFKESDNRLKAYWTNILEKLKKLQSKSQQN